MSKIDFNSKAEVYEQTSLVQKSASQILRQLLDVKDEEDVLDLGCGPGNITREIARTTTGTVVGVDVASGMIEEASKLSSGIPNLRFEVKDAVDLGFNGEFDVVVCNSAFQWFTNQERKTGI